MRFSVGERFESPDGHLYKVTSVDQIELRNERGGWTMQSSRRALQGWKRVSPGKVKKVKMKRSPDR